MDFFLDFGHVKGVESFCEGCVTSGNDFRRKFWISLYFSVKDGPHFLRSLLRRSWTTYKLLLAGRAPKKSKHFRARAIGTMCNYALHLTFPSPMIFRDFPPLWKLLQPRARRGGEKFPTLIATCYLGSGRGEFPDSKFGALLFFVFAACRDRKVARFRRNIPKCWLRHPNCIGNAQSKRAEQWSWKFWQNLRINIDVIPTRGCGHCAWVGGGGQFCLWSPLKFLDDGDHQWPAHLELDLQIFVVFRSRLPCSRCDVLLIWRVT